MAKKEKRRMGARTREAARKKVEESKGKGSTSLNLPKGASFFKVKDGNNYIDIVPYIVNVTNHPEAEKDEEWFRRGYLRHRSIGPDKSNYTCPKSIGKKCPICEYRNTLMDDWDENEKEIKDLRPSDREIFNIVDAKKNDEKVHLFDMSRYCFGTAVDDEQLLQGEEYDSYPELDEGWTLKVRFAEEKFGKTEYFKATRVDFVERESYDESIMEDCHDLDALLRVLPYEVLGFIMQGMTEDEAFDEANVDKKDYGSGAPADKKADEEEPEKKPARRTTRKKEADEEPKKPARTTRRSSKAKTEEEDEPKKTTRRTTRKKTEEEDEPKKTTRRSSRKKADEKEPEPKKPARGSSRKKTEADTCSHGGGWGDADELDECDNCEKYNKCLDSQ